MSVVCVCVYRFIERERGAPTDAPDEEGDRVGRKFKLTQSN